MPMSLKHDNDDSDEDETPWDVIIVGAGQAGMAAAHRLVFEQNRQSDASPLRLLILEASDHVGGRTRNYDVETKQTDTISYHVIELGGTWLSPEHTAVLKLCKEYLGLEVFRASRLEQKADHGSYLQSTIKDAVDFPWWFLGPDYSDEEMQQIKRVICHHRSPDNNTETSVFSTPEEFLNMFPSGTIDQMETVGTIIDQDTAALIDNPHDNETTNVWELPNIGEQWHRFDSDPTAEERSFLSINHFDPRTSPLLTYPDARNIMRGLVHGKNAEDPHKVSYLYNLISWQGANSAGPDMQFRVRGGTQAIPLTIAKKVENSTQHGSTVELKFNSPVNAIERLDSAVDSDFLFDVTATSGEIYRSKTILVTGSPFSLRKIGFGSDGSPLLPDAQRHLLSPESSPMGRCNKMCAVYKKGPWWREYNLQGDILSSHLPDSMSVKMKSWKDGQTDSMPLFPYCFDVSPHSGDYGVLCCFVEGAAYDKIHGMTSETRKRTFRDFLRLSFQDLLEEADNEITLWEPDEIVSGDWGPSTGYIGGAYTSYFPPRILTQLGNWQAYQEVEKATNVFWAGADYHAGFGNGYIEGAVRSGQLAADMIRERLFGSQGFETFNEFMPL